MSRLEVRHHAFNDLKEIFVRDTVALDGVVKRPPRGIRIELAAERVLERATPSLQRLARRAGLITEVIAVTHERINGAHRVALLVGEEGEGIVEIFGPFW